MHHDLWDYDVASPPILFDWRKDSQTIAAVGVASKTGHLFILDRETGTPLIPVEERPVPKSDVPGEVASPTQPFPSAPRALAPDALKPEEAWGATEEDRAWCRTTMSALRADGLFTPPSLKGTLVIPGNVGGMAWGGIAHNRINDLLVMPVNNLAAEVRLVPREATETERQAGRLSGDFEYHPQLGTQNGMVRRFLLAPKTRLPCTPPPWGTLVAVKAATGEIAWQVPLGQFPGTEKIPGLEKSGSIALGGPIATAEGISSRPGRSNPRSTRSTRAPANSCGKARCRRAHGRPDDLSGPRRPAVHRHLRRRARYANRPAARRLPRGVRAAGGVCTAFPCKSVYVLLPHDG